MIRYAAKRLGTISAVASTVALDDPCAYMPDDPAHADHEIALVRAALDPYWTL